MKLSDHIIRLRKLQKALEEEKTALISEGHVTKLYVPINNIELDIYELVKSLESEELMMH